ncbi:hypothetical protein ABPG74_001335 [Tetrahymena malaccensis]
MVQNIINRFFLNIKLKQIKIIRKSIQKINLKFINLLQSADLYQKIGAVVKFHYKYLTQDYQIYTYLLGLTLFETCILKIVVVTNFLQFLTFNYKKLVARTLPQLIKMSELSTKSKFLCLKQKYDLKDISSMIFSINQYFAKKFLINHTKEDSSFFFFNQQQISLFIGPKLQFYF